MRRLRRRGDDSPAAGSRYQMRERLLSIGDDYWIEDDQGRRAFRVDGKALRVRQTFVLDDADGNEVAKIQERKLSVRDKMAIERGGDSLAKVRKALRPRGRRGGARAAGAGSDPGGDDGTVLASGALHGLSARPLVRAYAREVERLPPDAPELSNGGT